MNRLYVSVGGILVLSSSIATAQIKSLSTTTTTKSSTTTLSAPTTTLSAPTTTSTSTTLAPPTTTTTAPTKTTISAPTTSQSAPSTTLSAPTTTSTSTTLAPPTTTTAPTKTTITAPTTSTTTLSPPTTTTSPSRTTISAPTTGTTLSPPSSQTQTSPLKQSASPFGVVGGAKPDLELLRPLQLQPCTFRSLNGKRVVFNMRNAGQAAAENVRVELIDGGRTDERLNLGSVRPGQEIRSRPVGRCFTENTYLKVKLIASNAESNLTNNEVPVHVYLSTGSLGTVSNSQSGSSQKANNSGKKPATTVGNDLMTPEFEPTKQDALGDNLMEPSFNGKRPAPKQQRAAAVPGIGTGTAQNGFANNSGTTGTRPAHANVGNAPSQAAMGSNADPTFQGAVFDYGTCLASPLGGPGCTNQTWHGTSVLGIRTGSQPIHFLDGSLFDQLKAVFTHGIMAVSSEGCGETIPANSRRQCFFSLNLYTQTSGWIDKTATIRYRVGNSTQIKTLTVARKAKVITNSVLVPTPASGNVSFEPIAPGQSVTKTFTIRSTYNQTRFDAVSLVPADPRFRVTSSCLGYVALNAACAVNITYTASQSNTPYSGEIVLNYNAAPDMPNYYSRTFKRDVFSYISCPNGGTAGTGGCQ